MAATPPPAAFEQPGPGPLRGRNWSASWTARVDAALAAWLGGAPAPGGVAVVALGSYARAELCPGSDIDVLLLHDGWPQRDLESLVQAVCYPLWDAGLSVGHAVRTPREAIRAAGERIDTATALVDRRLVAGDAGLLDDLASRADRWLRRQAPKLLERLAAADVERHAAAGGHPGMLEPDLKNGVGGLRDIQSLRWAAACLLGDATLDALVGARYIGAEDRRELADAEDALLTARVALHHAEEGGGRNAADADRLRLDLQDDAANLAGAVDGDALLRRVGLAMRAVAHVHARAWPRLLGDARGGRRRRRPDPRPLGDGVRLDDGLVEVDLDRTLADDPGLAWRACAAAAAAGTHLGRASAVRLRRQLAELPAPTETTEWDDESRACLLALLRRGRDALGALADADHIGLLAAGLPEWSRVRGHPQRNPFHRFDLDTHGIEAVAELGAVVSGEAGSRAAELWRGLDDPDVLLLATLFHDVGKAWPGDHSVVGAAVARRWVSRIGLDDARADRVAQLVQLHLLLPDTATRRDLDDPDEIQRAADAVGDIETLDGLYLLSLADARATGPAAASPWRDTLVADLHTRVRRLLAGRPSAPAAAELLAEARGLLEERAVPVTDLEALLVGLPRRYLRAADAAQVVEHAALLRPAPVAGELRARVRPGPAAGTTTLTVVAADRRGLIADCAGVLAGHGLTVLDARAYTRDDGVALDWFVLRAPRRVDWETVVDDLRRAAAGLVDVAAMVSRWERRRDVRPRRAVLADSPVEVRVERALGELRLEVHGPEAPGVLYRLARVLAEERLDVIGARVATLGPEVRDVFFVRPTGPWPDHAALAARLSDAAGWPDELLPAAR